MKKTVREQKAITLVALIITVIVLLILATVSINLVINGGIIDKTKSSVDKYSEEEISEQIKMSYLEYETVRLYKTNTDVKEFMEQSLGKVYNEPISVEKVGKDIKITFTNRDKIYKYYSNGIVKELMKASTSLYGRLDETTNTLYLGATAKDNYDIFNKWSVYYIIEKMWDKSKINKIVIEEPIAPNSTYSMFSDLNNLTTIEGIENLHTENSDSMYAMFLNCSSLININISNFDTSNVKPMKQMFQGCNSLKNITIGKIDTGNVTTMDSMFASCRELTSIDLSGLDTHSVTTIKSMFASCKKLSEIDLSNFDTTNLTSGVGYTFEKTLSKLNLSGKFSNNKNISFSNMFGWVGSNEKLNIKIKCSSDDETKIRTAYPNLTDENFE